MVTLFRPSLQLSQLCIRLRITSEIYVLLVQTIQQISEQSQKEARRTKESLNRDGEKRGPDCWNDREECSWKS